MCKIIPLPKPNHLRQKTPTALHSTGPLAKHRGGEKKTRANAPPAAAEQCICADSGVASATLSSEWRRFYGKAFGWVLPRRARPSLGDLAMTSRYTFDGQWGRRELLVAQYCYLRPDCGKERR
ncbi:unnamed protein product [Bursaphelenchus xylophilus]|uniref:(pine wood nematode) hypothetical protein n=1 Tax=Bursaphelenchus xylophilus TaxID=6326 RepID=A0A7I8XDI2_BURXY|nr:unnamed protein product [Bursaphelenchus xylophilus]CAG9113602.1 unnamed protein product [Bursaphelenchus xylophilus]